VKLTENLSSVNCGPRMDVLEVWCVRTEAVSMLDALRTFGSMLARVEFAVFERVQRLWEALYQVSATQRSPEAGVWRPSRTMRREAPSAYTLQGDFTNLGMIQCECGPVALERRRVSTPITK
jgi:hypothetical protein